VPSINAGLAASTVTPGSTAPDSSLTTPASEALRESKAGENDEACEHQSGFSNHGALEST
jgi:hypothetical protein